MHIYDILNKINMVLKFTKIYIFRIYMVKHYRIFEYVFVLYNRICLIYCNLAMVFIAILLTKIKQLFQINHQKTRQKPTGLVLFLSFGTYLQA